MTNGQWVEIAFDCVPLRTVGSLKALEDASPKFQRLVQRIKESIERHGTHNTYFLHRAHCTFHFTNDPDQGSVRFTFEGTVLTNDTDQATRQCDLQVQLDQETCGWLNEAVVHWLSESVRHAVRVEFDRYISAGDLSKTLERLRQVQDASDAAGGFLGMHL